MISTEKTGFLDIFSELDDPRIERRKLHPMPEILLLTLCAVISDSDSWDDIEIFGKTHLDFLQGYLPYKHGVPSDDTLRRFFRAVDFENFERLFIQWMQTCLAPEINGKVVAIDGKTLRGSVDDGKAAIHMVSAFASEAGLVLGQIKTSEKSNEITAIPELLEWLDIRGAIVTLDAMGCQKDITKKIIKGGGDYFISLKGNQGTLHEDVKLHFEQPSQAAQATMLTAETIDKGHGRIEIRRCRMSCDIEWLQQRHKEWTSLNCVVAIESERHIKDKIETETRYFIGSLKDDAEKALHAIRSHWGVENKLHWVLDMTFGEDQSRIRKGNAATNMAIVRHIALNMIKKAQRKRTSLKKMRKLAGWDNAVLASILNEFLMR